MDDCPWTSQQACLICGVECQMAGYNHVKAGIPACTAECAPRVAKAAQEEAQQKAAEEAKAKAKEAQEAAAKAQGLKDLLDEE